METVSSYFSTNQVYWTPEYKNANFKCADDNNDLFEVAQ